MGAGLAGLSQGWAGAASQAGAAGLGGVNAANAGFQANNQSYNQTMGQASGAFGNLANIGQGNQALLAGINAQNANNTNQMIGTGIGALATVAMMYSDRRLKTNVRRIGTRDDGLGVYEFEYIWGGPKRVGVMADEVARVRPDAVVRIGEFHAVDYAKL